jgi:phage N-6-adenine-methyltransferase
MCFKKRGGLFTSETDEWSTPEDFFNKLNREFQFELDVCATVGNAKCDRYFTEEMNGLRQDWTGIRC